MNNYRSTFTIKWSYPINGLSEAAYKVADSCQVNCNIDRETIKTGWFSRRYEYHIRFFGEKGDVYRAIREMRNKADRFVSTLTGIQGVAYASGEW